MQQWLRERATMLGYSTLPALYFLTYTDITNNKITLYHVILWPVNKITDMCLNFFSLYCS